MLGRIINIKEKITTNIIVIFHILTMSPDEATKERRENQWTRTNLKGRERKFKPGGVQYDKLTNTKSISIPTANFVYTSFSLSLSISPTYLVSIAHTLSV